MNLTKYTEPAIVEIFEMALLDERYKKYLPEIRKEIQDRLRPHAQLVKDFSSFGVINEMTLTKQDFIQSC
ncbi:MAG: hypothetical protein QG566_285 [Patescibacteria group bacterium]|jgi:hypothetical protein|nr:hypothetical protein [Patescibacteria group bacterium]